MCSEANVQFNQKLKPWGFIATGVLCVCMAICVIATLIVLFGYKEIAKIASSAAAENPLKFTVLYLVASPIVIILCIVFSKLRKGFSLTEYFGLMLPQTKQLLIWIGITAILFIFCDLTEAGSRTDAILASAGLIPLVVFSLMAIFLAPITEEIVFRGFAFKGLWHSAGSIWAVVLTGFAFSLCHMNRNIVAHCMILIFGILLGIARIRTGSLFVPIIMHSIANFIGICFIWNDFLSM